MTFKFNPFTNNLDMVIDITTESISSFLMTSDNYLWRVTIGDDGVMVITQIIGRLLDFSDADNSMYIPVAL